ncbi:unnamed protein product, partial [Effrenium voratum]
ELRLAMAQHSAFMAERELELRLELEQLQEAQEEEKQPEGLPQEMIQEEVQRQLSIALEEEAKAARRARQDLQLENELLRSQLRGERQRLQALQAENSALRTLLRCEVLGPLPSFSPEIRGEQAKQMIPAEPAPEEARPLTPPPEKARRPRPRRREEKPKDVGRKLSFAERDFVPGPAAGAERAAGENPDAGRGGEENRAAGERQSGRQAKPEDEDWFPNAFQAFREQPGKAAGWERRSDFRAIGEAFLRMGDWLRARGYPVPHVPMLDTMRKFRLARDRRRDSDPRQVDVQDWTTHMADLQGIMSTSKAIYLLLETRHESILRVALELALDPEARHFFSWADWYHQPSKRERFRQQVTKKLLMVFQMLQVPVDESWATSQAEAARRPPHRTARPFDLGGKS